MTARLEQERYNDQQAIWKYMKNSGGWTHSMEKQIEDLRRRVNELWDEAEWLSSTSDYPYYDRFGVLQNSRKTRQFMQEAVALYFKRCPDQLKTIRY